MALREADGVAQALDLVGHEPGAADTAVLACLAQRRAAAALLDDDVEPKTGTWEDDSGSPQQTLIMKDLLTNCRFYKGRAACLVVCLLLA